MSLFTVRCPPVKKTNPPKNTKSDTAKQQRKLISTDADGRVIAVLGAKLCVGTSHNNRHQRFGIEDRGRGIGAGVERGRARRGEQRLHFPRRGRDGAAVQLPSLRQQGTAVGALTCGCSCPRVRVYLTMSATATFKTLQSQSSGAWSQEGAAQRRHLHLRPPSQAHVCAL